MPLILSPDTEYLVDLFYRNNITAGFGPSGLSTPRGGGGVVWQSQRNGFIVEATVRLDQVVTAGLLSLYIYKNGGRPWTADLITFQNGDPVTKTIAFNPWLPYNKNDYVFPVLQTDGLFAPAGVLDIWQFAFKVKEPLY